MVTPGGHWRAVSSATASSATRGAFASRSIRCTNSYPSQTWFRPPLLGYERRCTSPSPAAVAVMPPPVCTISCSVCAPSVLAKVLRSRMQIS